MAIWINRAVRRLSNSFKRGEIVLLVCSDVAARGLDVEAMSHVFNFDVPLHAEDYVHRIGRTGRAGRSGTAYTIVTPDDVEKIDEIEKLIKKKVERQILADLPEPKPHVKHHGSSHKKPTHSRTRHAHSSHPPRHTPPRNSHPAPAHREKHHEKPHDKPREKSPASAGFEDDVPAFLRRAHNTDKNSA